MALALPISQAVPGTFRTMRRVARFLYPIFLLFLGWEVLVRVGVLSVTWFPPPTQIIATLARLAQPPAEPGATGFILQTQLLISAKRALLGFGLAFVVGVAVGILMGMNRVVDRMLSPIIGLFMPVPTLTWAPILLLALGRGDRPATIIVFLAAFFPLVYNSAAGVRSVGKLHRWAAQTMGASSGALFWRVLLPGALPFVIIGTRLAIGLSWRAIVAAEMVAASSGLGYMIFSARQFVAVDVMFAGIVVLAILGFALENIILGELERRTVRRWGTVV